MQQGIQVILLLSNDTQPSTPPEDSELTVVDQGDYFKITSDGLVDKGDYYELTADGLEDAGDYYTLTY